MGQLVIRTKKQIQERMQNRIVARTDLTDLIDGSSVKQVVAAAAREDDDQYFQMRNHLDLFDIGKASGPDLDERAKEMNPALIGRDEEQVATGEVRFSRTGTTGAITIPVGTEVQVPATGSQETLKYVTTEEATIADASSISNYVDIVSDGTGTKYNVDPDTIIAFGSKPSGVDYVTNPAALTNGRDLESDDSFRNRIRAYIKSLSRATNTALVYAALTAVDTASGKRVIFASVVEDDVLLGNVTVYIDDGAGTAATSDDGAPPDEILVASAVGGEIDFYTNNKPINTTETFELEYDDGAPVTLVEGTDYTLNPASGHIKLTQASFPTGLDNGDSLTLKDYTFYDGLIQQCQKIIDGDPSDRATYPGYRAAGVLVRVLSPEIVWMTFQANITVLAGFNQTDVASEVTAAVSNYINSLSVGEDVILNELRERCMAVVGMYDINVSTPTENRVILDSQLSRILSSAITVS